MTARDVLDAVADELGISGTWRYNDERLYLDFVLATVREADHEIADCIAVAAEYETEGR